MHAMHTNALHSLRGLHSGLSRRSPEGDLSEKKNGVRGGDSRPVCCSCLANCATKAPAPAANGPTTMHSQLHSRKLLSHMAYSAANPERLLLLGLGLGLALSIPKSPLNGSLQ